MKVVGGGGGVKIIIIIALDKFILIFTKLLITN
jgi:hypothetical protein